VRRTGTIRRQSRSFTIAAVLVTGLSIVACAQEARLDPDTSATVGVLASGCSLIESFGTGISLSANLIATSAHTVAGATTVRVVDTGGDEHAAQVVGFDPQRDVAVLMVETALPHATLGPVEKGDTGALATWHPDDGFARADATVTRLLRVTIEDIWVEELTERRALEIEADVVRGDSGGPVFTADGEVAGIIYAASRNREGIGFAVRSEEISAVLEASGRRPVDNGHCP